ncbi:MAG: retron system putative HNH endonuclease [Byssovorax sp.]
MHKLDRASVPVPACLASPDVPGPQRKYKDLHSTEKDEIRRALFQMQGGERCAYCERRTSDRAGNHPNDGHVEHFRDQANNQHLDRHWPNLFWSCNDEETCGKHKDKCRGVDGPRKKFNIDQLIDPCADDPERFLLFIFDGTVRVRDGISTDDQQRAEETLRVFQLDKSPVLRRLREDAVKPYLKTLEALRMAPPTIFVNYIREQLVATQADPFATAIKHYLESFISP